MATGAAGGLAAAFNAPLAGVVFAIEELGRGVVLHWGRRVLLGVLAAGFILVAIKGNNPYFPQYAGATTVPDMALWVGLCGIVCGVLGGIFARLLFRGAASCMPAFLRGPVRRHPILLAIVMGLLLAALGTWTHGQTYGTGYQMVTQALDGHPIAPPETGLAKLAATVFTYWTGIAGGIFTPALSTGAGIGSHLASLAGGMVDERLLVLLCMSAFLAGATQSPVTASVIVMEMTGSQPVLIWSLIGSLVAALVSRQIHPRPFYHSAAGASGNAFRKKALPRSPNSRNPLDNSPASTPRSRILARPASGAGAARIRLPRDGLRSDLGPDHSRETPWTKPSSRYWSNTTPAWSARTSASRSRPQAGATASTSSPCGPSAPKPDSSSTSWSIASPRHASWNWEPPSATPPSGWPKRHAPPVPPHHHRDRSRKIHPRPGDEHQGLPLPPCRFPDR